MSVIKGIRQDLFCQKNTLLTTPAQGMGSGFMQDAILKFDDEGVEEYRGGMLPHKVAHSYERKTYQSTLTALQIVMLVYALEGVDLQVVANKLTGGVYGGVYNYTGANRFMGVDFEFVMASKERYLKLMAKQLLDVDEHLALMQDSITAVPLNLNTLGLGHRGVVEANYRKSNLSAVISPAATVFVDNDRRIDHRISFASVSTPLEDGRPDISHVAVTVELTINKAYSWELCEYLVNSKYAYLELQEKVSPTVTEKYIFNAGSLIRTASFELGKDKRLQKFIFRRNIQLTDFVFDIANHTLTVSETV